MTTDHQIAESVLCEAFFEAAGGAPGSAAFERALVGVEPLVRRAVARRVAGWARLHDLSLESEDIAQEVLSRLMTSPPTRRAKDTARKTLLAWVKTVANNLLCDQRRRLTRKTKDGDRVERYDGLADVETLADSELAGSRREIGRFHDAGEIEDHYRYLERAYPAGARWVAAMRDNPGATGNELAALMGVTRANYDQIARRTRIFVRNRPQGPSREQK